MTLDPVDDCDPWPLGDSFEAFGPALGLAKKSQVRPVVVQRTQAGCV